MKRCALMVLVAGLLVAADAKDDVKKELTKLEGTWLVTSLEANGEKLPDDAIKNFEGKLTMKGEDYKVKFGQIDDSGKIKVDPAKKPKTIDVMPTEGENKGKTIQAIYVLDGDKLKVCYDITTKGRPTEFVTKDKEGWLLIEYKREKAKK